MKDLCIDPIIVRQIKNEEQEIRRIQIEAAYRDAFKTLNSATGLTEGDPAWLWKLKMQGPAALNEDAIRQAFIQAIEGSDSKLRAQAVKAVDSPFDDSVILMNKKTQWRILEFWLAKTSAPFQLSFCYYNDKALAKLMDFQFGLTEGEHNDRYIRKIWERLGLKKSPTLLFRDLRIQSGVPYPVPYAKVIQPAV